MGNRKDRDSYRLFRTVEYFSCVYCNLSCFLFCTGAPYVRMYMYIDIPSDIHCCVGLCGNGLPSSAV